MQAEWKALVKPTAKKHPSLVPTRGDVHEAEAEDMELKELAGLLYSIQLVTLEHYNGDDPCPAVALGASKAWLDIIASFTQEWSQLGYNTPLGEDAAQSLLTEVICDEHHLPTCLKQFTEIHLYCNYSLFFFLALCIVGPGIAVKSCLL